MRTEDSNNMHEQFEIIPWKDIRWCSATFDCFNPIQDGSEAEKGPSTSFSPVTSASVGISPQNFLTFSFNPLL